MRLRYIFFMLLLPGFVLAQGVSRGSTSLKLPITPFVAATAESFVADPISFQSALINPANLAAYESYNVMFSHTEWIQDIQTEYLAVVAPFRYGSLALSIANNSINGLELRTIPGPPIGTFNVQSTRFQLTYGVELTDNIRLGITPKYLYEKIFIDEATGFGIDAGLLYLPKIDGLTFGCSLTNLGSLEAFRAEKVDLPSQLRLGGTYSFSRDKFDFRAAIALSSELGVSVNHLCTGIEAVYDHMISIRIGNKTGYEFGSFSMGIGIRYNIFVIDYAYLPSSIQIGDAHIISIDFIL